MKVVIRWLGMAVVLLAAGGLWAQEAEKKVEGNPSPDEVTTGEIRLVLTSDYAKVLVDGGDWEEHEFLDNGKTLIIHTVKRADEHKLNLTPITSELAPVELTIATTDWKLVPISKTEKVWRVEKKVAFPKAPKSPPAK